MAIPLSTIIHSIPTLGTEPLTGTTPERRMESCRAWRAACLRDASLLIKAASECRYMTKQVVMGLFVLSNAEANALPRTVWPRKESGLVYRYEPARVIVEALRLAGGVDGMKKRLLKRARYQASVEVAFGENWRELYLPRRGHVQITC